jgi:hypothetical protein
MADHELTIERGERIMVPATRASCACGWQGPKRWYDLAADLDYLEHVADCERQTDG